MTYQTVRLSRQGEVATLTLSAKMGSMGPDFWREMPQALAELGDARVLIVRGEKIFSAGLDVKTNAGQIGPVLGDVAGFKAVVAEMHAATEGWPRCPFR